jgi:CBS domain-containing protein
MSSPVQTIPAQAYCFDALVRMMKEKVGHLAVEHRKNIVGIVDARDITIYQGASPLYLFREIGDKTRPEGICEVSGKIPVVVRTLVEEGARAENIAKVVTLFGDNIHRRLLTLVTEELGPPPVPFCWLMLGSQGRREQTFRTDQDNALVYQDPQDGADRSMIEQYFQQLSELTIDHLCACGYPVCRNKFMASNPRWCKPFSTWKEYFTEWIHRPIPPELDTVKVFLDFRPIFGDRSLGTSLRDHVAELLREGTGLFSYLATDLVAKWPPLSFFRDHVVERDGEKSGNLDLKRRALAPVANFARLLALRNGIRETNTIARLRRLVDEGQLSQDRFVDLREAYEFYAQLQIVTQLRTIEAGLPPADTIRPGELSDLEKRTLKEAFTVIERMLSRVQKEFGV